MSLGSAEIKGGGGTAPRETRNSVAFDDKSGVV